MRKLDRIGIDKIRKRKYILEATDDNTDSFYLQDIAEKSITENTINHRNNIAKYFRETCNSKKNANKYYKECIRLIEKMDDVDYQYIDESVYAVCDQLVYRLDENNLSNLQYTIDNSSLSKPIHDKIEKVIDECVICDIIICNDNLFHKRFNVDDYLKLNAYKPLRENAFDICSLIDTYKVADHIKMSIAIDEINYLYQSHGLDYDRSILVESVLDYFLYRDKQISNETFKDYQYVLSENVCIDDDDLSRVRYFMNENFDEESAVGSQNVSQADIDGILNRTASNKVVSMINAIKMSNDKRLESLLSLAKLVITDVEEQILIDALKVVFSYITDTTLSQVYTIDDIKAFYKEFVANIITNSASIHLVDNVIQELQLTVNSLPKDEENEVIEEYRELLIRVIENLNRYREVYIDGADIKKEIGIKSNPSAEKVYTYEEYRDDITRSINDILNTIKLEFSNPNNTDVSIIDELTTTILWTEKDFNEVYNRNQGYLDCITENNIFDHTVAIFDISDTDKRNIVFEAVGNFCKFINSRIYNETTHIYYTRLDSIVELHLEDTNVINLTEEQQEQRDNCFTEAELTYIGMLQSLYNTEQIFSGISDAAILEKFDLIQDDMTSDQLCSVIELSRYMGGVLPLTTIQTIAESYHDHHPSDYYGNNIISNAIEHWKLEEVPIDIVTEATETLHYALLNEINTKVKMTNVNSSKEGERNVTNNRNRTGKVGDKSTGIKDVDNRHQKQSDVNLSVKDKDKEEKPEREKITFNTLKFAAITLRKKAQRLDVKAKKITKDMDAAANRFMRAVKDLYTNDNRESVIRGSIIPSFHKLMQQAIIGAIGSGIVAIFNPVAAMTTAALYVFSLIAISKHNTNKERALLIDEIDIELKVVENELQRTENNGSSKKYRILLAHQKKLQRERARIIHRVKYSNMVLHTDLPDK